MNLMYIFLSCICLLSCLFAKLLLLLLYFTLISLLFIMGYRLDYIVLGYHRCHHGSRVWVERYAPQVVKGFDGQEVA